MRDDPSMMDNLLKQFENICEWKLKLMVPEKGPPMFSVQKTKHK